MKKILISIALFITTTNAFAFGWFSNKDNKSEGQELALELFEICSQPDDLLSGARSLLRRYIRGELLNSVLYDEFLWVHPEHVEFISCVICNSGIPNNKFWESEFNACEVDPNQPFEIMVEKTTTPQKNKVLKL